MKTCDSCRFWKEEEGNNRGECSCDKFIYSGSILYDKTRTTRDSLTYWDYEAYNANFETGPKFGCIHHSKLSV